MVVLPLSLPLIVRSSDMANQTASANQLHQYDYPADSLVYAIVPGFSIGIATVAAALRLWTRARILRRLTIDDWLLLIAQILAIATLALWLYARSVERNYAPGSAELLQKTAWVCTMTNSMPHTLTNNHSHSLLASCYTSCPTPRSKCHVVFSSFVYHKVDCKEESISAPSQATCYVMSSLAS